MKILKNTTSMSDLYHSVPHDTGTSNNRRVLDARATFVAHGAPLPVELPRKDRGYRIQKRIFDVTVASIALVMLAPFFAVVALVIKATSPGPVFFRQQRYGLHNELFSIFKFRTMDQGNGDVTGVAQTVRDDPRVTAIGRLLRKTSFDELPQLFNILKGEMSVVGPRPHVPGMLANGMLYEEFDQRYFTRHVVKPGLTGLAQVKGFRGETTEAFPARRRLECDLEYIKRQSIGLDIKITAQTIWKEFFRGSGY